MSKRWERSLKQLCVRAEANEGDRCLAHFGLFYPNEEKVAFNV